jgi:hypothetical protein
MTMVEFVLILTLIGNTNQSGQAIEHIGGFGSEQQCIDAGNAWLKAVSQTYGRIPRALCVKRAEGGQ